MTERKVLENHTVTWNIGAGFGVQYEDLSYIWPLIRPIDSEAVHFITTPGFCKRTGEVGRGAKKTVASLVASFTSISKACLYEGFVPFCEDGDAAIFDVLML